MERRHGGLLRGLRARATDSAEASTQASGPRYSLFLSLRGGMTTMVDALIRQMPEVRLRCAAPVVRITKGTQWELTLETGEMLEADVLCLAVPTHQAARLLRSCAPDDARTTQFCDVETALERLGRKSCLRERPDRCPLGERCPQRQPG